MSELVMVIEDEKEIRDLVRYNLEKAGYRVAAAADGEVGLKQLFASRPDALVLDLMLPGASGLEILRELRAEPLTHDLPVLVLTARSAEMDKLLGFEHGADDYLTKPFSTAELLARIRVALRHAGRSGDEAGKTTFEYGELKVDLATRRVFVASNEVHLTPIEYKLLTTLVRHAGKVMTHRQLLKEVWGPQQTQETHYLRVFMANLRRKLETDPARPQFLLTEQGVGYRLASD